MRNRPKMRLGPEQIKRFPATPTQKGSFQSYMHFHHFLSDHNICEYRPCFTCQIILSTSMAPSVNGPVLLFMKLVGGDVRQQVLAATLGRGYVRWWIDVWLEAVNL